MLKTFFVIFSLLVASFATFAQAPAKKITKDEVFHALAAQVITQSDSPLTNVIGALDEVIEVGEIAINPKDGKTIVTVKEKAESNNMSQNKAIQLMFALQPDNKWSWEQFKNDAKFYPVEKLFPYAKDDLSRRREAVNSMWKQFLQAMAVEGEAAAKLLDTAKVVIKKDPEPLAAVNAAREAIKKAVAGDSVDAIKAAYQDLNKAVEPIAKLTEDFPDLKANDAYLRLYESFENTKKSLAASHKNYFAGIAVFNDRIQRLPFALTAFGFGFVKLEPQLDPEQ